MTPAEVADRAREQAEDRAEREHIRPGPATLDDALSQVTDLLVAGKTVDGWTMIDIIDCWLEATPNKEACKQLAATLNVFAENGSASAFWLNALEFQKNIVKSQFPEDSIYALAQSMERGE